MTMELTGKVAVVTGGAQGIGLAVSRALSAMDATVVVADIDDLAASAAADELGGTAIHLDASDPESIAAAAAQVTSTFGRVDVLVNNAGTAHEDDTLQMPVETWHRVIALDLTGLFHASREFGAHMVAQGSGSIVNIASISGMVVTTPEFHSAYDAAKAGVIQLTKSLAVEWAPRGVRVNGVAPGRTITPLLAKVENPPMAAWLNQVPQHRLLEADEIAAPVAFLATDLASGITGHTIVVDGGTTASA